MIEMHGKVHDWETVYVEIIKVFKKERLADDRYQYCLYCIAGRT